MAGRFGRALERLNSVAAVRLTDSAGSYCGSSGIPVNDIPLSVDRGVGLEGANEIFHVNTTAITWPVSKLSSVSRGGIFTIGKQRYVVEEEVANDGHWGTAACMESR